MRQTWPALGMLLLALGAAWGDGMLAGKADPLYDSAPTPVELTPVHEDGQRAVVHWDDGVETLLLDVSYYGAETVAWLVPVPAPPTRDDVFLARQALIDRLFDELLPQRIRQVRPLPSDMRRNRAFDALVPWPRGWQPPSKYLTVSAEEALLADGGRPPSALGGVSVLARRRLDVYDTAVLEADRAEALVAWLQSEGFSPPEGLAPLAADYLRRGWRFVAVRCRPAPTAAGAGMHRLPPLGLRFASERPVFPLTISRASAPPRTMLDLLVIHPDPVRCATLTEIPTAALVGRGKTLDERRRQVIEQHGHAALLRYGCRRLSTRDLSPGNGRVLALDGRAATRFWSLLDREAMVDLEFTPARSQAALRTLPHERATTIARISLWQTLARQPWPPVLVAWITATLLLANGRRAARATPAPRGPALLLTALRDAALALLTGGVLVALASWPLRLLATAIWPGLSWLIDVAPPDRGAAALTAAALILASGVIAIELRGRLRGAGQGARRYGPQRAALATAVVALLALLGWRTENRGVALPDEAAAGAIVWATLATVAMATGSRRTRRLAAAAAGGIAAAFLFAACLLPTIRPPSLFAQDIYERAAVDLLDAVDRCIDDVGCLPARLEDVARPWAPRYGVDRSGNRVDIHPARWRGPYVEAMPIDPTTSRRGTWRYEPTGEMIVDGGRWDDLTIRVGPSPSW